MPSFCFYAENRLGAPTKLRSDFMGRGESAASQTRKVSFFSQATFDESPRGGSK